MHAICFSILALSSFSRYTLAQNITVGIIGAGVTGLYSAILLQSLDINYEIIEANNRTGGRIWTHYFDPDAWAKSKPGEPEYYDYFDAGAMRIPDTPFMDRLISNSSTSLINYLNSNVSPANQLNLIPYILSTDANNHYYNGILRSAEASQAGDPFKTNLPAFQSASPTTIWNGLFASFMQTLQGSLTLGFQRLTDSALSVREYLTSQGLQRTEVDWLETFLDGTGHFDYDLAEVVLEDWVFGSATDWVTVEGGMSRLISAMESLLKTPVVHSQHVTSLSQNGNGTDETVTVGTSEGIIRRYDHVINTVPLGAMQMMDMNGLNLPYEKTSAIRMINYDPAVKIGMKFKSRWWQNLPNPIYGGQSECDLPIRVCVYPSYGINVTNAPGVMIASYTWGQDAHRFGAYSNPNATQHLIDVVLRNLATVHAVPLSYLQDQFLDFFTMDWYASEFSVGAFAEFAPGQSGTLLPEMLSPGGRGGRVHFAGEALSIGHAWIAGGLNSGFRAVQDVAIKGLGRTDMGTKLSSEWGPLIDVQANDDGSLSLRLPMLPTNATPSAATSKKRSRR